MICVDMHIQRRKHYSRLNRAHTWQYDVHLLYKAAVSLCVCVYVCLYFFLYVCLSVCSYVCLSVSPLFDTTVGPRPNLACICRLIWEWFEPKQMWPTSPQGAPGGDFRGSKIEKSGKCHELPRKSIIFLNPHPILRLDVLGVTISKVGEFHQLPRKLIHF